MKASGVAFVIVALAGCSTRSESACDRQLDGDPTGSWIPVPSPAAELGPATTHGSQLAYAWTGTELLVWGGCPDCGGGWGARYNPQTNTWSTMANTPPAARYDPAFVWTGDQLIVWSGQDCYGDTRGFCTDGGRYNPNTDSWLSVNHTGEPTPRNGVQAVWTGTKMLVWGGHRLEAPVTLGDGAAYDPSLDQWTPISAVGAPSSRASYGAVWTGTEMLIWGGGSGDGGVLTDGAAYNPETDRWRSISTKGAVRAALAPVWTGTEMIVWDGEGAAYNPTTDQWRPISCAGPGPGTTAWTGSSMIIWDGEIGGVYDPVLDEWTPMSQQGAPWPRYDTLGVWTGTELLVWGGETDVSDLSDGGRFTP